MGIGSFNLRRSYITKRGKIGLVCVFKKKNINCTSPQSYAYDCECIAYSAHEVKSLPSQGVLNFTCYYQKS